MHEAALKVMAPRYGVRAEDLARLFAVLPSASELVLSASDSTLGLRAEVAGTELDRECGRLWSAVGMVGRRPVAPAGASGVAMVELSGSGRLRAGICASLNLSLEQAGVGLSAEVQRSLQILASLACLGPVRALGLRLCAPALELGSVRFSAEGLGVRDLDYISTSVGIGRRPRGAFIGLLMGLGRARSVTLRVSDDEILPYMCVEVALGEEPDLGELLPDGVGPEQIGECVELVLTSGALGKRVSVAFGG